MRASPARLLVSPVLWVLLPALVALGCKDDPPPTPRTTPPSPATPPAPVEPAPATAAPVIEVKAARALVDRWLAAQNAGDFDGYAALYAARFYGIKRAGERTTNYDRAGWIADRRRMFQRPMTVGADEIEVVAAAGAARVRFVQTWASGNYRDIGPKQLVITRTDEGLRIAREEMLASTVLDGAGEKDEDGLDFRFALVLDAPYVVLGPAVETDAQPVAIGNRRPRAARAAAPAEAGRAWVGRQVTLYGADGRLCAGRVLDTHVVARVIPHFGIEQEWKGELDPSDRGKPTSEAEITRQVWSMSADGGRVLAGRIDAAAGECAGAVWARFEEAGAAPMVGWSAQAPVGDQEARALAIMRGTDPWRDLQAQFVELGGGAGSWDQSESTRTAAKTWRRAGAPDVVVVTADAGPGCGGFGGGMWQAFVDEKRTLRPLGRPHDDVAFVPQAVADLDGDGQPELIGIEGYGGDIAVYGLRDGVLVRLRHLPVLDLDTPC